MLKGLSDEALGELGQVLAEEPGLRAKAASPDVYSQALSDWLLDACAREQGMRRGEEHGPLPAPSLGGEQLIRARAFAAALAATYINFREFIPAGTTAATRERYERMAAELAAAMLTLCDALSGLQELTSQPGAVH